jgi:hypothetical protein
MKMKARKKIRYPETHAPSQSGRGISKKRKPHLKTRKSKNVSKNK